MSGKTIVPLLYGAAVLLCGSLLWYGLSLRDSGRGAPFPAGDRAALADLPREWTRISLVEGQGWVVFVPCNAEAGSLNINVDAEPPLLLCAWCDSVQEAGVARVSHGGQAPRRVQLKLREGGMAVIESVDDAVAGRFAGAPLHDYVLTWTLPGGAAMYFVPEVQAGSFEVLRAADESPEGCLGE